MTARFWASVLSVGEREREREGERKREREREGGRHQRYPAKGHNNASTVYQFRKRGAFTDYLQEEISLVFQNSEKQKQLSGPQLRIIHTVNEDDSWVTADRLH